MTGATANPNFDLLNPLQSNFSTHPFPHWPLQTAFLTWVDSGGTIRFSTYWGGTSERDETIGYGIARGGNGDIFVCGEYQWGTPDSPSLPQFPHELQRFEALFRL